MVLAEEFSLELYKKKKLREPLAFAVKFIAPPARYSQGRLGAFEPFMVRATCECTVGKNVQLVSKRCSCTIRKKIHRNVNSVCIDTIRGGGEFLQHWRLDNKV